MAGWQSDRYLITCTSILTGNQTACGERQEDNSSVEGIARLC